MGRKRKAKKPQPVYLSTGPLPQRIAQNHTGRLLIFSDASQLKHGGLSAVLFETSHATPLISTRTVALAGSNELELQAAIFALEYAQQNFPDKPGSLFTDNQDAAKRLNQSKIYGFSDDPMLEQMLCGADLNNVLNNTTIHWIKGHGTCRGNSLADLNARVAASK